MRLMRLALLGACMAAMTHGLVAQEDRPDPVLNIVGFEGLDVVEGQLLVAFQEGTPASAQRDLHREMGTTVISNIRADLAQVALPEGADMRRAIERYEAQDDVRYADPNLIHYTGHVPNDPNWGSQYGPQLIECPDAWDKYLGDSGAIISIVDTGIRHSHDDLDDHYVGGWDYYAGDSNPSDANGHGTHCSGIASAETDNGVGIAGVAYQSHILAYRTGDGSLPSSALVASIDDSVVRGARVISMSWGSLGRDQSIADALTRAHNAGLVLVAAAGNNGSTGRFYPAFLPEVISVAAVDRNDNKPSWSNYGWWVDVAAPGADVYSTWRGSDNDYATVSGTSMACPHVAGMAGLLYALLGNNLSKDNAALIRGAIEGSTDPVGDIVANGRVNLSQAIDYITGDAPPGDPPGSCVNPANYGSGTAGTGGLVPDVFWKHGWPYIGNQLFTLEIQQALPNSTGFAFVGFSSTSDSGGGWELLVNPAVVIPVSYDNSGGTDFEVAVPNNPFIIGLPIYAQFSVLDPGASGGVAATDGIQFTICVKNT